jgi:hypothetical protein
VSFFLHADAAPHVAVQKIPCGTLNRSTMLRCNMESADKLQLALDDLLADLRHARRTEALGRMALIAWCEVRPWARKAGEPELAAWVSEIFVHSPHPSREAFLRAVDELIGRLAAVLERRRRPQHTDPA